MTYIAELLLPGSAFFPPQFFYCPLLASAQPVPYLIAGRRGSCVPSAEMPAIVQAGCSVTEAPKVCASLYYVHSYYIQCIYVYRVYIYAIYVHMYTVCTMCITIYAQDYARQKNVFFFCERRYSIPGD